MTREAHEAIEYTCTEAVCMTPTSCTKTFRLPTGKLQTTYKTWKMLKNANLICRSSSPFQLDSFLHFAVGEDSFQVLTITQQLPSPQSKTNAVWLQRAGLFNAWAQGAADWPTRTTKNTLRTYSIFMTSFEPANQLAQKFTALTSPFIHKTRKILQILRSQR